MKNDTPVAFGNLWLSKRGTKAAVVAVVRASVNDCVCASVRMSFL